MNFRSAASRTGFQGDSGCLCWSQVGIVSGVYRRVQQIFRPDRPRNSRSCNEGGQKVPLSEHEQRLLEQMERALHEEDPKLASTLRHGSELHGEWSPGTSWQPRRRIRSCRIVGRRHRIPSSSWASLVSLMMLGGTLMIGSAFRGPKQAAVSTGSGYGRHRAKAQCQGTEELRWLHVES